ncbi:MAG: DinB family protein [Caldilineales bacterium]|nr:DinB family protein [Caldilineales bacterium]
MDNIIKTSRFVLYTTPRRWSALCDNLPDDLLKRPPMPGEWSALACLHHLVDTERSVFSARVQYILDGKDFPAFSPDDEGTPASAADDAKSLAEEFAQLRARALLVFDKLRDADLTRTARHSELGVVTLGQLLHEWAAHDLMHTVQAERALMQPFIAGSGPWLPYFADHWVGDSDGENA